MTATQSAIVTSHSSKTSLTSGILLVNYKMLTDSDVKLIKRAFLDPCSQNCYTSGAYKRLKFKFKNNHVPTRRTGVVVLSQVTNTTEIPIESKFNFTSSCITDTFILPSIPSYTPISTRSSPAPFVWLFIG